MFDIQTQRKKKSLKDKEDPYPEFVSKDFVSCAFSSKNEKHNLITLTGDPDWVLLFWEWEKMKILTSITVGVNSPVADPLNFKCTFSPYD